jgi:copper chaperone CopZ
VLLQKVWRVCETPGIASRSCRKPELVAFNLIPDPSMKLMKIRYTALSMVAALGLAFSSQADDVTAKITNVHLCCGKCVTGVEKAVGTVDGAKAEADKDAGTVTITAPDKATAQKAADALIKAGYFGKCSDDTVKIHARTGAKGEKVKSMTVSGVHLCCDKCVKGVNEALKDVSGVSGNTAAKGAKSFEVTGDFTDKDVMDALQKAGLTGKVEEK